ncbi:DUF4224 domain-containing protein [Burkholderia gladioli]|nr:DUF4224 domain-containing protein [Burkholderia gladioli]PRH11105.1 hypothetical protein C6V08_04165 [Burkholderia gladioli]
MESLTLTEHGIIEATGYRQPARQLSTLLKAGIPADRRPTGTVRVWRHHVVGMPAALSTTERPRPKLKSDR